MIARQLSKTSVLLGMGLILACSDQSRPPTAVTQDATTGSRLSPGTGFAADLSTTTVEPFTYRATLDPFTIHQLPDFLMQSKTRSDIVIQRSIFNPGNGPWHYHPGPSFVYVLQGQIKVEHYMGKDGCMESEVRGPGSAYFEVGNMIHRAIVTSGTPAVLLVTRFNVPVGGAFTINVADPGC